MTACHAPFPSPRSTTSVRGVTLVALQAALPAIIDERALEPRRVSMAPAITASARPRPRVPTFLPEPAPLGLGPSVAELTIGRPPRAPRPGE